MYILRTPNKLYLTLEPITNPAANVFPADCAWTESKGEAVRFSTIWHAKAVAKALPCRMTIVSVR